MNEAMPLQELARVEPELDADFPYVGSILVLICVACRGKQGGISRLPLVHMRHMAPIVVAGLKLGLTV